MEPIKNLAYWKGTSEILLRLLNQPQVLRSKIQNAKAYVRALEHLAEIESKVLTQAGK